MLTIKNKRIFCPAAAAAALILISFSFAVYGHEEKLFEVNGIDTNEISESNPFAQFMAKEAPAKIQNPQVAISEPKPDLFVETATLKFVDAKSLKATISNMSSEWGGIEPDGKNNALIICDTNENIKKIIDQIRKIDHKPEQIMIEVVLVDVKLDKGTELGVNWDLLTTRDHDAVFRQNLDFTSRLGSTIKDTDTIGNATAFNTTGTGSDLWLLWPYDIRTVIHAIQEKNNVEIIASPRVMVVSGQTASIQAVEEIPYKETSDTSGGGELTSTQFKNVGVTLKIGATLTDDKFIHLEVETEQSVQTGTSIVTTGSTGVPVVDTRNVQSSLLLNDGQVLVIGGLRRKETQKQTNQIPLLGDLPIVGYAFKATDTIENSSELLIILSPHIYKGEAPNKDEMAKYNEITQRPLLSIPESEERKQREEKEKQKEAEKTKKTEAAKKAKEVKEAKEMNKKTKIVSSK